MEGTTRTQVFEVTINNIGPGWVLTNDNVKITVSADGLETVVPGVIDRLRPGDRAIVQLGAVNANGTASGTSGSATVTIAGKGVNELCV